MPPPTRTAMSPSQLTSRCSTKNCAMPPDSTLFSTCFDMGMFSLRGSLGGHRLRRHFDRRAVVEETRARSHNLFTRTQSFGDENRAVENVAGLHDALHRFA